MSANYFQFLKRDWRKLLVITLAVLLLVVVLTLIQPFQYQATVSILVLQKSGFSIDAYSASKSEERIATKLGQVVYASSFLDKVLNSGFNIDKTYFPSDELKRRKKWAKTVETVAPAGLSKLEIAVYHTDPNQALQISQAVAYVLTTDKSDYLAIGDVDLRVLDTPLVSKYPVKPNIVLNIVLGIVLGLFLGAAYVIVSYNPKQEKWFGAFKSKDLMPHLVKDNQLGNEHVAPNEVPTIENLEDIPELKEAEAREDKPVEKMEDIPTPDLTEEIGGEVESSYALRASEDKELPSFEEEGKIFTNYTN